MSNKNQYPDDFNPQNRGKCEVCGYVTRAYDPVWLTLCPKHWQELEARR